MKKYIIFMLILFTLSSCSFVKDYAKDLITDKIFGSESSSDSQSDSTDEKDNDMADTSVTLSDSVGVKTFLEEYCKTLSGQAGLTEGSDAAFTARDCRLEKRGGSVYFVVDLVDATDSQGGDDDAATIRGTTVALTSLFMERDLLFETPDFEANFMEINHFADDASHKAVVTDKIKWQTIVEQLKKEDDSGLMELMFKIFLERAF